MGSVSRPLLGKTKRRTITLSLSEEAIAVLDIGTNRSATANAIILGHAVGQDIVDYLTDENRAALKSAGVATDLVSSQEIPPVPRQETPKPVGKPPAKPKPDRKSEVIADLKDRMAATKNACAHPNETKHSWGVVCADCGHRLR